MDSFYIGDLKVNMNPKFKDLGAQKVLYKYRDWNNEFHKKTLIDPSVYLCPPRDFEDPLDCVNPTRYDLLTDSQIFEKFYNDSKKENPRFNYEEHFNWAYHWYQNTPIRNPLEFIINQNRLSSEFNDRFGVLSLTENPYNLKMWEKYGANNKGFCIAYDSEKLFKFLGSGCKVTYTDDLPRINAFENFMIQHFKQIFFKTTFWSFEEEYRLHTFWDEPVTTQQRNITISNESILEVLLGYDMSETDKNEITTLIESNFSEVKITQLTKEQIL